MPSNMSLEWMTVAVTSNDKFNAEFLKSVSFPGAQPRAYAKGLLSKLF